MVQEFEQSFQFHYIKSNTTLSFVTPKYSLAFEYNFFAAPSEFVLKK